MLFSSFGEENFQRFAFNLLCSNCLWLLLFPVNSPVKGNPYVISKTKKDGIGYEIHPLWVEKNSLHWHNRIFTFHLIKFYKVKCRLPLKIGGSPAKSLCAATSLTFENVTSYGQKTPGHGM